MKNCSGKGGYTIIELVIVVSLIMIIVAITVPRKYFFTDVLLQNEIENIFVTFSFLQNKAVASNKKLALTFSPSCNSYSYVLNEKTVAHELPKQVTFGFLPNTHGPPSGWNKPDHRKNKPLKNPITFKQFKVIFSPTGHITPGTVYLVDAEKKYHKALTCPVSQVSFIRKY